MKLENVLRQIYTNHTNIAHKKSPDYDETNPVCHIRGNLGTSIPSKPYAILAVSLLPSAISNLKAQMPAAKIEVGVDRTRRLLNSLRDGKYDFVVSTVPDSIYEDLIFETLYDAPLGIFVRKSHPVNSIVKLKFKDLVKYPWIYPSTYSHRMAEMENLFQLNLVQKPDMALSTMSISLSRHAMLNQNWVILIHKDIFNDDLLDGRITQVLEKIPMRTVQMAVARKVSTTLSETAENMINILKSCP